MLDIKKYPKSKKNFQCLGQCYHAKTKIIHPISLETVTDNNFSFCAVNQWADVDPETGQKKYKLTDVCYNPTADDTTSKKELELNLLIPYVDFNENQFLTIFYAIYSFEDAVAWIDKNKFKPINTKLRILNMALKIFGDKIDLIDGRFVDFFIDIVKKKYINELYKNLKKYIKVTAKETYLYLSDIEPTDDNDEIMTVKKNFIVKTFINNDDIFKFITRYMRQRRPVWNTIINFIDSMFIDLIAYIINKINITLKI